MLKDSGLRDNAYKYQTLLALIGSAVSMIPIFFYDLTEAKHANIVRVLKIRAASDNYASGELEDKDILNTYDVIQYAKEHNDKFLQEEIAKHNNLQAIIANYSEIKQKVDKAAATEHRQSLERNAEIEHNRINNKTAKAKAAAAKKKTQFDEDAFRAECISKAFYINQLAALPAENQLDLLTADIQIADENSI